MADSPERIVVNFDDVDLSDVCLVVGNTDFSVLKMTLVCRSTYFKATFFGDFKEKKEKRISIEADPAAFQRLLEIAYKEALDNESVLVNCHTFRGFFISAAVGSARQLCKHWNDVTALWQLSDQFDFTDGKVYLEKKIKQHMCPKRQRELQTNYLTCFADRCSNCVYRKLFAMEHDIDFQGVMFSCDTLKYAYQGRMRTPVNVSDKSWLGLFDLMKEE